MQKPNLSEKKILSYASNYAVFERGQRYYTLGKVVNFKFLKDIPAVKAFVKGSYFYDVNIVFSNDGEILECSCDCEAFNNYSGVCKHVIAVLLKAMSWLRHANLNMFGPRSSINTFFSEYDKIQTSDITKKELVKLDVILEFSFKNIYCEASLQLKIGQEKMYIIKNIKEFLRRIIYENSIEMGKRFTFNASKHCFLEQHQKVIDILKEMFKNEEIFELPSFKYSSSRSIFWGRKLFLSQPYLEKILCALSGHSFTAIIEDNIYENTQFIDQNLPTSFFLSLQDDKMVFSADNQKSPLSLSNAKNIFFYDGKIYRLSPEQSLLITPIYKYMAKNHNNSIVFKNSEKERFISEIFPLINSVSDITIDKNLEQRIVRSNLVAKIYFDKYKNGISAKINFHYDDKVINPFFQESHIASNENEIIYIRDSEKEKSIIQIFEKFNFFTGEGLAYLSDNDKIYDFITDGISLLQELAEVYYSESFKNINIKKTVKISGGVSLSESNLLLSFDLEDVDDKELESIFLALHEKKKYFRLKNGSFIPLESDELKSFSNMLEQLDVSYKDIKNKFIELPKYKSLFMDRLIEEAKLYNIKKNNTFTNLVNSIKNFNDIDLKIPKPLNNLLREYQKTGFKWLKTLFSFGFGGILADDMGLGKTLQVITLILSEKKKNSLPSIVICPTSLVYNWQDEINKFAPELKSLIVSGSADERAKIIEKINNFDIIITSYNLIRRDIKLYDKIKFLFCILDEAQHIKNPNTINSKSVKSLSAKGYFALTGTPIENNLTELWSIFDFVMPGYLLSHNKFVKKFEEPIVKEQNQEVLKQLTNQINPFILRRLKKDVLLELPKKIETKLTCEMNSMQSKIYLAYLKNVQNDIKKELEQNGFEKSQIKILAALTRLRQICCHPSLFLEDYKSGSGKLELFLEILDDSLSGGHRVLIFSQFKTMLELIKEELLKLQVPHYYLDGSTKAKDRLNMVNSFNNGLENINVFLISLKAGGLGLNLTGADTVIHFDPWWNPAVEDQASDRAYRIGQKKSVQIIKLITKYSIEEKIFELQQSKKAMIDSVIKPGETFISKMNEEDIRELLRV